MCSYTANKGYLKQNSLKKNPFQRYWFPNSLSYLADVQVFVIFKSFKFLLNGIITKLSIYVPKKKKKSFD